MGSSYFWPRLANNVGDCLSHSMQRAPRVGMAGVDDKGKRFSAACHGDSEQSQSSKSGKDIQLTAIQTLSRDLASLEFLAGEEYKGRMVSGRISNGQPETRASFISRSSRTAHIQRHGKGCDLPPRARSHGPPGDGTRLPRPRSHAVSHGGGRSARGDPRARAVVTEGAQRDIGAAVRHGPARGGYVTHPHPDTIIITTSINSWLTVHPLNPLGILPRGHGLVPRAGSSRVERRAQRTCGLKEAWYAPVDGAIACYNMMRLQPDWLVWMTFPGGRVASPCISGGTLILTGSFTGLVESARA